MKIGVQVWATLSGPSSISFDVMELKEGPGGGGRKSGMIFAEIDCFFLPLHPSPSRGLVGVYAPQANMSNAPF